jgi:hypothetical protein
MTRESDWSLEEFAVLVASAEIAAATLASTDLPTRSPGAIEMVRRGLHRHHMGQPLHGMLSLSR